MERKETGYDSDADIRHFPCISRSGFCPGSCSRDGRRRTECGYSPWGDQLAEICKDCQKSDIGTERKPLYAGGNLIWMQYRKTDFETYSAKYHRTDPCDCHAGYRNDDDGACRPVVSGTWCKTAGCGVGKHDE